MTVEPSFAWSTCSNHHHRRHGHKHVAFVQYSVDNKTKAVAWSNATTATRMMIRSTSSVLVDGRRAGWQLVYNGEGGNRRWSDGRTRWSSKSLGIVQFFIISQVVHWPHLSNRRQRSVGVAFVWLVGRTCGCKSNSSSGYGQGMLLYSALVAIQPQSESRGVETWMQLVFSCKWLSNWGIRGHLHCTRNRRRIRKDLMPTVGCQKPSSWILIEISLWSSTVAYSHR